MRSEKNRMEEGRKGGKEERRKGGGEGVGRVVSGRIVERRLKGSSMAILPF
jgi:hypothetical protein